MLISTQISADHPLVHDRAGGFRFIYRDDQSNHCPSCGRQHWIVGRVTAECAFCETALPLDHIRGHGYSPRFVTSGKHGERPPEEAMAAH